MGSRLVAEYVPATQQYFYYMQDQIGSTRVVTNDTGAVVYAEAHDPYGGIQKTWVNDFDPKRKFSDKERDQETELDYFGVRYYSRYQYRWISVDSVLDIDRAMANTQSWNLYSFCENDPVTYSDPNGRSISAPYLFPLNDFLSALHRAQLSISRLLKGIHVDIAQTDNLEETNYRGGLTYSLHNINYKIMKKGDKWVIKVDFEIDIKVTIMTEGNRFYAAYKTSFQDVAAHETTHLVVR